MHTTATHGVILWGTVGSWGMMNRLYSLFSLNHVQRQLYILRGTSHIREAIYIHTNNSTLIHRKLHRLHHLRLVALRLLIVIVIWILWDILFFRRRIRNLDICEETFIMLESFCKYFESFLEFFHVISYDFSSDFRRKHGEKIL